MLPFFFLLFPPVTQHDPISVRVQAIPAHVVQTGEWLLVICDEKPRKFSLLFGMTTADEHIVLRIC